MPDPAPAANDAAPAAVNPAPPPANTGPSPPAAPPTPPAQPAPATATASNLDPNTQMEIPKADGSGYEVASLQEMADALMSQRAGPAIDSNDVEKFNAFKDAVSGNGDPEAAHKLVDMYSAPKAAPVPDTNEQIAALQAELQATRSMVDSHAPLMRQIEDVKVQGATKGIIEQYAAQLPYLARDSAAGAQVVVARVAEYRAAAESQFNMTPEQFATHPRRQEVLLAAFKDSENRLRAVAERFKGFDPQAAAPAPTPANPGVVDDQAATTNTPGRIQAPYRAEGGLLVPTNGQPAAPIPQGPPSSVPSTPLSSEPSGTAVGPEVSQPQGPPRTMKDIEAQMRTRLQEMNPA